MTDTIEHATSTVTTGSEALPTPATQTPQPVTIVEPTKPTWDEELSDVYDKLQVDNPEHWTDPAEVKALREGGKTGDAGPKSETADGKGAPSTEATPVDAPQSWSAEMKANWGKYSPAERAYFADREKHAHTKIAQQGTELSQFAPVREVYDWIRTQGVPAGREPEVIANWARAQAALDANPEQGLLWLANSYGVDLGKLAGKAGAQNNSELDDVFGDPRVEKLASEVQQMRTHQQQLYQAMTQSQRADYEGRLQQNENFLDKFAESKPDWDEVAEDIVPQIDLLKQSDPSIAREDLLEKAYDRARWANPVTRARMLEEDKRKGNEEAAKRVTQARRMQSMNMRSGASASTPTFDGRWDDNANLSSLYDNIVSGKR